MWILPFIIFKYFILFYFILGETSAGKSLLINLFLGEEILPSAHTRATSTICEIRYGEQRKIKAYFKSKDPATGQPTKEISLEPPSESSEQNYVEQISPFVNENASLCTRIELFWPHPLLQVIIFSLCFIPEVKINPWVLYFSLQLSFCSLEITLLGYRAEVQMEKVSDHSSSEFKPIYRVSDTNLCLKYP